VVFEGDLSGGEVLTGFRRIRSRILPEDQNFVVHVASFL
jgi:hypothetical protein